VTISTLDSGWFGKGIYFTSDIDYAAKYYSSSDKAGWKPILLSFVVPGNPYPGVFVFVFVCVCVCVCLCLYMFVFVYVCVCVLYCLFLGLLVCDCHFVYFYPLTSRKHISQ